jgi:purine-binding chemotaxis protein CheW
MTPDAAASEQTSGTRSRGGKFLTFDLAGEFYGLEILKVREIIGMMSVTNVPHTKEYVKGVINLRGKIIPVIDLRLKLGMDSTEMTRETCTIVVDVNGIQTGLIVDKVAEVLDISDGQIEDAPAFGGAVDTDFILGMGKTKDKVIILLDISKILSASELAAITNVAG